MRQILLATLVTAMCVYAQECDKTDMEKARPCHQVFQDYPTFQSGDRYMVGGWVCFSKWPTIQSYKDTTIKGIPVDLNTWYRPRKEVTDIERSARRNPNYGIYLNAPMYIQEYVVLYGNKTVYEPLPDGESFYLVRNTPDVYYENGIIEVFRKDGSLRYKGKIMFENESVNTSGDCYNKTGSAITKHTNNASTCK